MARKDDGLLQTGHRSGADRNQRRGTPRIIWVAVAIAIVGAFFLFRGPGGHKTSGIGENHSVITVPSDDLDTLMTALGVDQALPESTQAAPRSGAVEIQAITPPLTPEHPESGTVTEQKTAAANTTTPIKRTPTPAKTTPAQKPAVQEIRPDASGPYLVQVASFGNPSNADKKATKLQALGWDARVKVSGLADGSLVYRVRIGFFKDRHAAEQFIHAHRTDLRGAIAVHR